MPFTIQELPPLPGGNFSSAHDLNDADIVVGSAEDASGNRRAVYWSGGVVNEIPTPTGTGMSVAHGINATGAIVGIMTPGPGFDLHAFLWDGVTVHDLGPATDVTRANAINDSSEMAGSWQEAVTNVEHPVMWTPGFGMIDLGSFGFPFENYATAIANAPVIAGASTHPTGETHAFLWLDGTLTDLGTLGGTRSIARALLVEVWPDPDGSGLYVVGGSEFPGGGVDKRAFLWHKGTMNDLGTLPGWFASEAHDINASLQIVGYSRSEEGGVKEHAVLWDSSGVIADLNALISDPTWDVLQVATSINVGGVIAGYGQRGGGQRAFVLTPS